MLRLVALAPVGAVGLQAARGDRGGDVRGGGGDGITGAFIISLDESGPGYRGLSANVSRDFGLPKDRITFSPGVLADERLLKQPWVREAVQGAGPGSNYSGIRGNLGVTLAHIRTWRQATASPACRGATRRTEPYVLVLEDDEAGVGARLADAVQKIVRSARRARHRPDWINLNPLRPMGLIVDQVDEVVQLLRIMKDSRDEDGRRPNLWTSAYLLRCRGANALAKSLSRMRYQGKLWNGADPQLDTALSDLFVRSDNHLRQWVVSPSQAFSRHDERVSEKADLNKRPPKL